MTILDGERAAAKTGRRVTHEDKEV